jgi:hypothetical protein
MPAASTIVFLLHGRGRIVVVLLADGVVRQQFPVAFDSQKDRRQVGPGLAQRCPGGVEGHLEGRRIDLVEQLAGLDVRALCKQAFLDDSVDLGPDLGDPIGRGAAGQLGGQFDPLRGDGHRGHLGHPGRRGRLSVFGLAAAKQQQAGEKHGGNGRCGSVAIESYPHRFCSCVVASTLASQSQTE